MDRKINPIALLIVLTTLVAIVLAAHVGSEYMYFGNASTMIFWLTAAVGTVVTIITGLKAIDMLTERSSIVR
jgi:uncharacterized membrane protein